jgi:16S rRNA (guanine(527)-N(7))-methyltransferase RsmG
VSRGAAPRPPEFFAAEIQAQSPLFGLSFELAVVASLARYLTELDRWRRWTNLTGPLSPEHLVSHALESAFGQQLISHGARVVDIGSGAGLPGIPLALARPDISMTLLEPRGKRASFLLHVVRKVPVVNARVEKARASELDAPEFDTATVRAVGGLLELLGRAAFLEPKGSVLAWTTKPAEIAQSLASVFELQSVLRIPGSAERAVALLKRKPGTNT